MRPHATYRFQFHADFPFTAAQQLVPYLSRLGVSHVYSSPLLRARKESTHGYDVVDPTLLNPNIGDEMQLREFAQTLQAHGLGLVVDTVPNHMATGGENPYWMHVLTYGPASPYARWFDIDFRSANPKLWGRVQVPVLGDLLVDVIDDGELQLNWTDGRFELCYYEHSFPLDPATVPMILRFGMPEFEKLFEPEHPTVAEVDRLVRSLEDLPRAAQRLRRNVEIDIEETERILSRLAQIIEGAPQTHDWAIETCQKFSTSEDFGQRMRKLLRGQSYRLAYWRRAAQTFNYRRFFNINDLISIRQEDPEVFTATHSLIARLIGDGLIDGLRIDHIDGLRDPKQYLDRLSELIRESGRKDVPVWIEKILAPHESLPESWKCMGTSGYEFLNEAEAIFINPEGLDEVVTEYRHWLRRSLDFEDVVRWGKRRILKNDLSSFVGQLADMLERLLEYRDEYSDLTRRELIDALVEFVVALPVYRTYIDPTTRKVTEADREVIGQSVASASEGHRASQRALRFLGEMLLVEDDNTIEESELRDRLNFIARLQQLTGPAAAKGVEDTALYRYVPLTSLNEVGGEPNLPLNDAVDTFHHANMERVQELPFAMVTATTHDTKRNADVRARLDVLSEWPTLWTKHVSRWHQMNRKLRGRADSRTAPDRNNEYLYYQTLVGVWPTSPKGAFPDRETLDDLKSRLVAYMLKAVREAKRRTSWTEPSEAFEAALQTFIEGTFAGDSDVSEAFLQDVHRFVQYVARPGFWNSLSRCALQYTVPGTPDLYQGDELWSFSLVDPDNRRPVDYEHRSELLNALIEQFESGGEVRSALLEQLVSVPEDGRIKLHTVHRLLKTRRQRPELFGVTGYTPLTFDGEHAEHAVGFLRTAPYDGEEAGSTLLTITPRLVVPLIKEAHSVPPTDSSWGETTVTLPEPFRAIRWRNVFTHEVVDPFASQSLSKLLASYPVACLVSVPETASEPTP